MARISKDEWDGSDEPHAPGMGPADIQLTYRGHHGYLDSSVQFTIRDEGAEQGITGARLLSAAAFLVESYCRAKGIPVEEVNISVKRPES